jgi:hypothetical protein
VHLAQLRTFGAKRKGTPSGVPQDRPPTPVILSDGAKRRVEGPPYFVFAVAVFAVSLSGCRSEPPDVVIHNRLVKLAGAHATDCGRATTKDQYTQHSSCALDAFNQKKPFFVQYKIFGTDAIVEQGIALDQTENIFSIETTSSSPLYRGGSSGKVSLHKCDTGSLHKLGDEKLDCSFPITDND